jgi:hypothetical protein
MKTTRIITIIITLAILITVLACPAFAAEVQAPATEEPTSNIAIISKRTAELHEEENEVTTIDFIPLYSQRDYAHVSYGKGNIHDGGCGLVSLWMIATYLNDEVYDVEALAAQFGDYYVRGAGSLWILFKDSAKELGLNLIESDCPNGEWYDWTMVKEALANNQPVICLQDSDGIFTTGGHFIVLTGITEDGKILVNDPNGYSWEKNATMIDGFANGFTEKQILAGSVAFWIYEEKEEPTILEPVIKGINAAVRKIHNDVKTELYCTLAD